MTRGENIKGGKSVEPAVPVDRAKRDQAKVAKRPKAIYMLDNTAELFDGHFMLTIKDNANNCLQADLLYLTKYSLKFCKAELINHNYEFGKQQRFHIHAICKAKNGKMPSAIGLTNYLKKYTIFNETTEETEEGHIIHRKRLCIDSLTFRLTPITDDYHLEQSKQYIYKEDMLNGPDFTDDLGPNPLMDEIMVQWNNY